MDDRRMPDRSRSRGRSGGRRATVLFDKVVPQVGGNPLDIPAYESQPRDIEAGRRRKKDKSKFSNDTSGWGYYPDSSSRLAPPRRTMSSNQGSQPALLNRQLPQSGVNPQEIDRQPVSPTSVRKQKFNNRTSGWGYYPDSEPLPPPPQRVMSSNQSLPPPIEEKKDVVGFGYYPEYERREDFVPESILIAEEEKVERGYWYLLVANFLPIWFSCTMGGGIVPVILHLQFVQFNGLNIIVNILFALNAIIFIFFTIITLLRYIIWPHKWWEMLSNPVHALFIGTFPMGLSTLINLTAFMIVPNTGQRFVNALWAVWWIDAILSAISILLVSFLMMTVHPAEISGVTAAWVLPIVPGIVAAAAGGNVAAVLPSDGDKIITILASYILIGLSFPLGIFVAVVYFQRLVLYKIPPRAAIPSTFLPLGLSAQTSLGLILLGKIARDTFPKVNFLGGGVSNPITNGGAIAGQVWYAGGVLFALILWAFAVVWFVWAVASICLGGFPFSMGWWAFTFPIGVLTSSTIQLGMEFNSMVFNVTGTVLAVSVTLIWALVFVKTLVAFCTGEFFR